MRYATWGMKAKVLSLIIVPTLILLLMFTLFIGRDMENLQLEFEERGYLIANQVAIASEYGVITENMDTLNDAVRSVSEISDVKGVVILSPEQDAYIEEGYVQFIKEVPGEFHKSYICHHDDAFSIFCAPILYTPFEVDDFGEELSELGHKVFIGSIQLSISSKSLGQKKTELLTYAVAFILFAIISTLLMARRIETQIIEPILELTGVVHGIGSGDLEHRAMLKSSGEIRLLQDGVNLMATELSSYHTDMELKILSATEGLRAALREIEKKSNELEIAWNQAEEASQAKTLFLAAISHEIRTPLSGMLGMLNLIEQSELNPLQLEQIRNIEQSSKALKSLIDDILDFSRIEAGKLNIVNKPFSIASLVEEVVTMLAPSAQMKGLEFVVDIEHSLPEMVLGDSLRVRQVLINILSNAFKFTEAGQVVFRIHRSHTAVSSSMVTVCFEIEDSGIGIPPESQKDVFERFSQVDQGRERHYEGSGLGATTAKQLVELMGGDISLYSEVGVGSRFTINLCWPVHDVLSDVESSHQIFKGEQILVLDGHQEAGNVLKRYLQDFGASVSLLQDTTGLLDILTAQHYDRIVICDEFNSDAIRSELQGFLSQRLQEGTLVGTIISSPDHSEKILSAFNYDFVWIKPLTPLRLERFVEQNGKPVSIAKNVESSLQLTLLVAEDDEINAKVITFLLEKRGHKVTRVTNGDDALQELRSRHYDAVFMDVRMPNMSGIDATQAWRGDEKESEQHIPIIALTANDSERELCLAVGMDGFILKPINNEALDQLESMIPGLNRTNPEELSG